MQPARARKTGAAVLSEVFGTPAEHEALLDQIGRQAAPFGEKIAAIREERGNDAADQALVEGEMEVERIVYGGSAEAFAAGVAEIREAAGIYERLTGAPAGSVAAEIDRAGALADPTSHNMLLSMARSLLKGAKP